MKVSELIGAQLDWAVAKCEGIELTNGCYNRLLIDGRMSKDQSMLVKFEPSTDWSQGGPIIEREKICPDYLLDGRWLAISRLDHSKQGLGPTLLIAAMRCYVASQLGDTIEIPDELFK